MKRINNNKDFWLHLISTLLYTFLNSTGKYTNNLNGKCLYILHYLDLTHINISAVSLYDVYFIYMA